MPKKLIPMAICYDFDGTLSPKNMQEYGFMPLVNVDSKEFWKSVKEIAKRNEMDEILAYMKFMLEKAGEAKLPVRKESFRTYGATIELFPGVGDWFRQINTYAKSKGVRLDHYIISSGLRELIEGTPIYREFKKVYASGFMFDHNGVACWPALALNYTTKTQFLFRINKGSLDVHDNSIINKYIEKDQRSMPFGNMIFIGDGETDIPCMRLVKDQGGHSVAVYNQAKKGAKIIARQLVKDGRATMFVPADYLAGGPVDTAVRTIIDKVVAIQRVNELRKP